MPWDWEPEDRKPPSRRSEAILVVIGIAVSGLFFAMWFWPR